MTRRTLALLALISASLPALAQDVGSEGTDLDAILVTDPEEEGDPRPAVSAVNLAEMPGGGAGTGMTGLLNGIAGVTTEQVAGDPAIAVNIRGLQGDGRVVVTIDGARQNFGRAGHGANGTFTADPEMLREIAVTRGPAGAGAAAGAIGGTLALRTVAPDDLIAEGETSGSELRLRYGTLTADPTVHLAWATRLAELGDAWNPRTGDLNLSGGVVTAQQDFITFSGLNISNAAGVRGDVHAIVGGLMGGGPGGTTVNAQPLTDIVMGGPQNLRGSSGADRYVGTRFADTVAGMDGNDTLSGGGGRDRIDGGAGDDLLRGGKGADRFIFRTAAEADGDRIADFNAGQGDMIHLAAIDAAAGIAGNQAFDFIGRAGFSGTAGELRFGFAGNLTRVLGDIDGDGQADFRITLTGSHSLTAEMFVP